GQMSYMTAQHVVMRRFFSTNKARDAAGAEYNTGPAHYTHDETQAWWMKVLDFWKVTDVSNFADALLVDGTAARTIDQFDVTPVSEFSNSAFGVPFSYNGSSSSSRAKAFITTASESREEIGFKVFWPSGTTSH